MQNKKSETASVVVIGGGIFGCAIAYYYTKNNPGKKSLSWKEMNCVIQPPAGQQR